MQFISFLSTRNNFNSVPISLSFILFKFMLLLLLFIHWKFCVSEPNLWHIKLRYTCWWWCCCCCFTKWNELNAISLVAFHVHQCRNLFQCQIFVESLISLAHSFKLIFANDWERHRRIFEQRIFEQLNKLIMMQRCLHPIELSSVRRWKTVGADGKSIFINFRSQKQKLYIVHIHANVWCTVHSVHKLMNVVKCILCTCRIILNHFLVSQKPKNGFRFRMLNPMHRDRDC